MIRIVKYLAIDPYYSSFTEKFIGTTETEIDDLEYDLDQYLGRDHPAGIRFIYKKDYTDN